MDPVKAMGIENLQLQNFDGANFNAWRRKAVFGMQLLKIYHTVTDEKPEDGEVQPNDEVSWTRDNDFCKSYLLNNLSDQLADVYSHKEFAKEIWEALEQQYKDEEKLSKTHLIDKFLDMKFEDDKEVLPQVKELEKLVMKLKEKKVSLCNTFISGAIVNKLPPSWMSFSTEMHRRKKQVLLADLKRFIRIEDEVRTRSKDELLAKQKAAANMVEPQPTNKKGGLNKKKKHSKFQKKKKFDPKNLNVQKKEFKKLVMCYNCGNKGHFAKQCKFPPKNREPKETVNAVVQNFVGMISHVSDAADVCDWWLDSGATCHVCANKSLFTTYAASNEKVAMANRSAADVLGTGTVVLTLTSGKTLTLKQVKHVPTIAKNLISGSLLCDAGMRLDFQGGKVVLSYKNTYFGNAYRCDGMFKMSIITPTSAVINEISDSAYSSVLWHNRLGHVNFRKMLDMKKTGLLPNCGGDKPKKCEICAQTKLTRKPFPSVTRSTELLELIHSDTCDFRSFATRAGMKYFITFIDDHSRFCHVYLLKTKDEAFEKFKEFRTRVEKQLGRPIKRLRSDRGGEYRSKESAAYFKEHGIIAETTSPHSPQSNGIAERKNRTLTEMVNSMLLTSGLPTCYWGEALLTANFILNRVPYAKTKISPHEVWFGYPASLHILKVWGCLSYVRLPDIRRPKLGPKTTKCVYLGFAKDSDASRFLDISTNSIIEARDAEFFEDKFIKDKNISLKDLPENTQREEPTDVEPEVPVPTISPHEVITQEEPVETSIPEEEEPRPKRSRKAKSFGDDFITFNVEGDPQTYEEAMQSRDAVLWKEAVDDEMSSLLENQTWELTDLPKGARPIGCKWVFRRKLRADGTVEKYKARLVAKGFTQKEGIDFFDTYAPVCRIITIRVLIAIAAIQKMVVHQMDVKTAFLNGDLTEEIYMQQPEGFVVQGLDNKVCKLIRSLYGLKQAPKLWHEKFDKIIRDYGFHVSNSDKCLYFKVVDEKVVIICLYVDDMLIIGTNTEVVASVKKFLSTQFSMKDLGAADTILGIKIHRTKEGISLSQAHYIESILKKYGYFDLPELHVPYDYNKKLHANSGKPVKQLEYSRVIGSLMYAMSCTRPDIAFTVGMLSRFTSNPGKAHWDAVQRLMRYLKATLNYSLLYSGYPGVVEGYSDASWCSEPDECRSTGGYVFTLGGAAISWKSKKQTMIAQSSMESEFFALASAGDEAEWLKDLLLDLPLPNMKVPAISIYCDNQATSSVAGNSLFNGRKRTLRLKHGYLYELIKHGVIAVIDVRSSANTADSLTKGLKRELIEKTSADMGLKIL